MSERIKPVPLQPRGGLCLHHDGEGRETDHAGVRFHLKAPTGKIICASQGYGTAERGMDAIKTHVPRRKV